MAIVQFTSNLKRFYPNLNSKLTQAGTIAELVEELNQTFPGIRNYITDDQKRLRHHVNVFINDSMIEDRITLTDKIGADDHVYIMQALSGG